MSKTFFEIGFDIYQRAVKRTNLYIAFLREQLIYYLIRGRWGTWMDDGYAVVYHRRRWYMMHTPTNPDSDTVISATVDGMDTTDQIQRMMGPNSDWFGGAVKPIKQGLIKGRLVLTTIMGETEYKEE